MTSLNQESRLNLIPGITIPRSKFYMHKNIRTTFNTGLWIPLYVNTDIMPGDTFKVREALVLRGSTPIKPVMDNAYLDIIATFTPHRLTWEHWVNFWGENETGAWTNSATYTVPKIEIARNVAGGGMAVQKGDLLNYMGIPILAQNTDGLEINALAVRAYILTWNDLLRDQNVCPPFRCDKGDTIGRVYPTSSIDWGTYDSYTYRYPKLPAPSFKYKDYFNANLPEPQKGTPISTPLGTTAPVTVFGSGYTLGLEGVIGGGAIVREGLAASTDNGIVRNTSLYGTQVGTQETASGASMYQNRGIGVTIEQDITKSGLMGIADLSNAVAATINAQRMAFAAQRVLEMQARAGTRYPEVIKSFFTVDTLNAVQQRPQYLGGKQIPIMQMEVAQTNSTDSTTPQGNLAAYSHTVDSDHLFTFSATEHGTLLILATVRTQHSYDQGIERQWTRTNLLDFYNPKTAFLGEQATLVKELYATGVKNNDEAVFGYNERWAELRYERDMNTGAFSGAYANTLNFWHFGDHYNGAPTLSFEWRKETKDNVDRTLAVTSAVEDQWLLDGNFKIEATRPLPMFSVPGLLDHF